MARPLRIRGHVRLAGRARRNDWHADLRPSLQHIAADERARLAQAWLDDALEEHASVASFARLALQLVALGAPPDLLRATQRATLDEIAHAELCFGLASAYAGRELGPGPLRTDDALEGALDAQDIAVSAVREGCIAETIGAMIATAGATRAEDPVVRAVLRRIAADETRHAGLAWRYLRWAVSRDRALAPVVSAAFEAEAARYTARFTSPPPTGDDAWWARHGRLSPRKRTVIASRTMREVILPCRDALLAEARTHAAAGA